MQREPVGLYVFRFIVGFVIAIFMSMLYWSSTLIEENIKAVRVDLSQLKNDLFNIRADIERLRGDTLETFLQTPKEPLKAFEKNQVEEKQNQEKPIQNPQQAKNLLQRDLFYKKVLPELLGKNFEPKGIQRTATVGKPDNLHPFSNWAQVSAWQSLCTVTPSQLIFGKYETMAPEGALRIEERINPKTKAPEFWVFLRNDIYWQPLRPEFFYPAIQLAPQFLRSHQVTAEDFKFFHDALMNPYVQSIGAAALRTYYAAVEEIELIDKLTFVVRWKSELLPTTDGQMEPRIKYIARELTGGLMPLPGFVYKYFANGKKIVEEDQASDTYRTNSVWAQNFTEHWAKNVIVSCGAWTFDGMTERQIKFKRNASFYSPLAALTAGIEVDFKDSPDNIWQAFKNGQLDSYILQPDQIMELQNFMQSDVYEKQVSQKNAIKRLDYLSRSYTYIGWNEARPYFQSAKVRRALTMAIDRSRIIRDNLNGLGVEINGTFYRYSPAYDDSIAPWPFSPEEALQLLQEEGWYDSDGDGILDKMIEGKRVPFRFLLTYYVKNPTTKSICEYIATALKQIGIDCNLNGVDVADLSAVFDDKNFDALCLAWALRNPPEEPRQLWHSSGAKEKGSSNAIGFANAQVDAIIDQLDYEYDPQKRIELYHQFDAIIHEEQPYTFLYTPKIVFLYREYLQNVFIPAERQDLIPGANVAEPNSAIFWIKS